MSTDSRMYRVKVTEKYSDYVWVKADSSEEALQIAPDYAECEFECLYDCEIVGFETILDVSEED